MEKHISELLNTNQQPPLTLKEVLATYDHVELTEDEISEAMLVAKQKKEKVMEAEQLAKVQEQNRQRLTAKTTYAIVHGLMRGRMEKIFEKPFVLDENNAAIFEMLCHYFGEDPDMTSESKFVALATAYGVKNPSLRKGILMAGNFGVGKSWMMKLFQKNQRQCFEIVSAKQIAIDYKQGGEDEMQKYIAVKKAAFGDPSVFYQKQIGLCIDDMGTEDVKGNYGDKKNTIGDIIEQRYFNKTCGPLLHGSTNYTSSQLKDFYGERVTSRMREEFNFIEFFGEDRRK